MEVKLHTLKGRLSHPKSTHLQQATRSRGTGTATSTMKRGAAGGSPMVGWLGGWVGGVGGWLVRWFVGVKKGRPLAGCGPAIGRVEPTLAAVTA